MLEQRRVNWQDRVHFFRIAARTMRRVLVDHVRARREGFLAQSALADAALVAEVRRLLAAQEAAATGALENGLVAAFAAGEPVPAWPQRIGPYRIQGQLGRGGMGTVYRAVRDDPAFPLDVAIKMIKRGMDSDEIVDRFLTERRMLASLDHPAIARLLDGGTTETGQPYFVLERIEGRPLDSGGCARGAEAAGFWDRQVAGAGRGRRPRWPRRCSTVRRAYGVGRSLPAFPNPAPGGTLHVTWSTLDGIEYLSLPTASPGGLPEVVEVSRCPGTFFRRPSIALVQVP